MKKQKSIFGKLTLLLALYALASFGFTQSGPLLPEGQQETITQLKKEAVLAWMQGFLKTNYEAYAKIIAKDREFPEKFISFYQLSKDPADKNKIVVTGDLDTNAIKSWINQVNLKMKSHAPGAAAFLISSSLPGFSFSASDTAARIRENKSLAEFFNGFSSAALKANLKLSSWDASVPSTPPRFDNEIKSLAQTFRGQTNLVFWANLLPCKACGGVRIDFYAYHLDNLRVISPRSFDMSAAAGDFSNPTKIKAALKSPLAQAQSFFEEMGSSDELTSHTVQLLVEGVNGLDAMNAVTNSLTQVVKDADLGLKMTPSYWEPSELKVAFELTTHLNTQELVQKLAAESFSNFRLKAVSVDPRNVVMRYSK